MAYWSLLDNLNSQYNISASPVKAVGNSSAPSSISGAEGGMVTSGVISAIGDIANSFITAQRLKSTAKFNAGMADIQKGYVQLAANVEIKNIRQKAMSIFSAQRAGYAKAGFALTGTPAEVMMHSQKEAETDAIYTQINADMGIGNIDAQSAINKMDSRSAQYDQYIGMGKTILKSTSDYYINKQVQKEINK